LIWAVVYLFTLGTFSRVRKHVRCSLHS
jgi:hypothetical protein